MKKHFSPTRLLQITRVDAFTQKRQPTSHVRAVTDARAAAIAQPKREILAHGEKR
jgi:hypothetical protein